MLTAASVGGQRLAYWRMALSVGVERNNTLSLFFTNCCGRVLQRRNKALAGTVQAGTLVLLEGEDAICDTTAFLPVSASRERGISVILRPEIA